MHMLKDQKNLGILNLKNRRLVKNRVYCVRKTGEKYLQKRKMIRNVIFIKIFDNVTFLSHAEVKL